LIEAPARNKCNLCSESEKSSKYDYKRNSKQDNRNSQRNKTFQQVSFIFIELATVETPAFSVEILIPGTF